MKKAKKIARIKYAGIKYASTVIENKLATFTSTLEVLLSFFYGSNFARKMYFVKLSHRRRKKNSQHFVTEMQTFQESKFKAITTRKM